MRPMRVIFERGLEIRCNESGGWSFLPNHLSPSDYTLPKIVQRYKVRPILVIEEHPSGKELKSLLSLDRQQAPYPDFENIPTASLVTSFRSLRYVIGAVCYRCERLALLYAETWRSFHTLRSRLPNKSGTIYFVEHGIQEEGYYEFDALLTEAIRCYETMRFPMWSTFGTKDEQIKQGPRKNFEETLKACKYLPATLSERLRSSWLKFGKKAKSYRDFIQHYFPLDRGFSQAKMELLDLNTWSASLLVPDNPEDKSPRKFRYDSKIDALTYGWELTNEILQMTALFGAEIHNAYKLKAG